MSPPGRHTDVAILWHARRTTPGAPMLLIRARAQDPAQKGCERDRRGLPHLSAKVTPQQPAARARNRSGASWRRRLSVRDASAGGLLTPAFVIQPTHEAVGHHRARFALGFEAVGQLTPARL